MRPGDGGDIAHVNGGDIAGGDIAHGIRPFDTATPSHTTRSLRWMQAGIGNVAESGGDSLVGPHLEGSPQVHPDELPQDASVHST